MESSMLGKITDFPESVKNDKDKKWKNNQSQDTKN
jgi:hypothetical protein